MHFRLFALLDTHVPPEAGCLWMPIGRSASPGGAGPWRGGMASGYFGFFAGSGGVLGRGEAGLAACPDGPKY